MDRSWDDALDALEEWLRRSAAALREATPGALDPAPALPTTAVPATALLRAQLLLGHLGEVVAETARRREQLTRQQAYGAA
jgi:hypothetical protein